MRTLEHTIICSSTGKIRCYTTHRCTVKKVEGHGGLGCVMKSLGTESIDVMPGKGGGEGGGGGGGETPRSDDRKAGGCGEAMVPSFSTNGSRGGRGTSGDRGM